MGGSELGGFKERRGARAAERRQVRGLRGGGRGGTGGESWVLLACMPEEAVCV